MMRDTATLQLDDLSCPCLGTKHAENPGDRAHVQYRLVLEKMWVVKHGVVVWEDEHLIIQHLVDAEMGIQVKVTIFGCHAFSIGLLAAFA
jgi:hypothetical protein